MSADAEMVPVAWLYEREESCAGPFEARHVRISIDRSGPYRGETETPLYSADTIAALRKRPAEQERKEFEDIVSGEPFVRSVERFPDDPERYSWPGDYKDANVSFAWHVWQARAAIDAAQSTEGRNG